MMRSRSRAEAEAAMDTAVAQLGRKASAVGDKQNVL